MAGSVLTAGIGAGIGYVVFELVQIATTVVLIGSLGTYLNAVGWVIPAQIGAGMCAIVLRFPGAGQGMQLAGAAVREGAVSGLVVMAAD